MPSGNLRSVMFMPVYNQVQEFPRLLEELHSTDLPCDTLLIVNNGSNDGTAELIRGSGFAYLDLPLNRGVGYSYQQALEWALARDYDIFGTMAGNGKMLPSEMHRVLAPVENGTADYVTGSRFLAQGDSPNLPRFRRFSIPLVNVLIRIVTGATVTDATCGYRAIRLDLFRRAEFDWRAPWLERYGMEPYIYAKVLMAKGVSWTEVPVTMRYPPRGKRYSKIRPIIDWYRILSPWIVARFEKKSFAPHPISERATTQ